MRVDEWQHPVQSTQERLLVYFLICMYPLQWCRVRAWVLVYAYQQPELVPEQEVASVKVGGFYVQV